MFMADLNMLAVTGGQERTETHWRELLDSAVLALLDVRPVEASVQRSPVEAHHSTIEARARI